MLLLDADRAGLHDRIDELMTSLPRYTMSNRLNVLTRLGARGHAHFASALDVVLGGDGSPIAASGDVAEGLLAQLAGAILKYAPDRMRKLIQLLPDGVNLLSLLAYKALSAGQLDDALALYERLLVLPMPEDSEERTHYVQALNSACIQAHGANAFDTAVRLAERAQPVAHENPFIYHSAACAYAAVGAYAKALEQVKLAVAHDYEHLDKLEVDTDLGELLEWPEFKATFRAWHTRQERN